MHRIAVLLSLSLLATSGHAAVPREDPQRIEAAVQKALAASLGPNSQISILQLDQRLRLNRCATEPMATPPRQALRARATIAVSCPDSWTIYLPIQVTQHQPMVVLTQPVASGQSLSRADLALQQRPVHSAPLGYISDLEAAVGQVARQPLAANSILRPSHLRAGRGVQRGQRVNLVIAKPGFQIQSQGEALADASIGGRVRVKNLSSERVIEGWVKAPGIVEVR